MHWGVSHSTIASGIGISRQAVGKHVRRGMPTSSVEDARAWYSSNVTCMRRRMRHYPVCISTTLTDDDHDDALAYLSRTLADEDQPPKPVKLDDYPPGFWGEDATTSILSILAGGADKPFASREHIAVAFLCRDAAMRRHLFLLPEMLGDHVNGKDREAAKDALFAWSEKFCAHWFGEDFRDLPMLSGDAKNLSDFYAQLPEDISN